MKEKELRPLLQHLETLFPGYKGFKRLLIAYPIRDTLQGFLFDDSDWDKSGFYPSYFIQPLFMPWPGIILSFGDRLRPKIFHLDEVDTLIDLRSRGLHFLRSFPVTERGPEVIPELRERMLASLSSQREYAFMLARLRDKEGAILGLDRHISMIREERMENGRFASPGWARIAEENMLLRNLLAEDMSKAQEQLAEWRSYTLRAVKLEKIAQIVPTATASQ